MIKIIGINGPVIRAMDEEKTLMMLEKVFVGELGLVGEVIKIIENIVTIQVYEDTDGMKIGEVVRGSGSPLSLLLAPGLMSSIFDGILRPLTVLSEMSGDFIKRGSCSLAFSSPCMSVTDFPLKRCLEISSAQNSYGLKQGHTRPITSMPICTIPEGR